MSKNKKKQSVARQLQRHPEDHQPAQTEKEKTDNTEVLKLLERMGLNPERLISMTLKIQAGQPVTVITEAAADSAQLGNFGKFTESYHLVKNEVRLPAVPAAPKAEAPIKKVEVKTSGSDKAIMKEALLKQLAELEKGE